VRKDQTVNYSGATKMKEKRRETMPATKLTLQATSFKRMQLNDNDEYLHCYSTRRYTVSRKS